MQSNVNIKNIDTDVLVIGGGMAGFFAAIKAREKGLDVTLVDKNYAGKSGATHFSEGYLTYFNPESGLDRKQWLAQIDINSEYINNRTWSELVLNDSYERYKDLVEWGVQFIQDTDGEIYTGRTGAHEQKLMIHREYTPVLRRKALETGVRILDRIMVCELVKQDGRVSAAVGFHTTSGYLYIFKVKAIIVTTGGSSLKTAAKPTHYLTSDGVALGYNVGVEICGKEFITADTPRKIGREVEEEHRTIDPENVVDALVRYPFFRGSIMGPGDATMMIPGRDPALNAEGGIMTTAAWEVHCGRAPLYKDYDDYLLHEEKVEFMKYFYKLSGTAELDKIGWDPFKGGKVQYSPGRFDSVEVPPGGEGIWPIDTNCATSLPGLYAAGNCAATMLSGASYAGPGLGLCHAAVSGTRAGEGAAAYSRQTWKPTTTDNKELERIIQIVCSPVRRIGGFSPGWMHQALQGFAIPYFILHIKREDRLKAALTLVEFLNQHIAPLLTAKDAHEWRMAQEAKNMCLNMEMVLRASIFRTESRGEHFREEYPRRNDPEWLAWVKIKNDNGKMTLYKEPVPQEWWPDLSKPYEELYPLRWTK